jgi:hypothetical protein
VPDVWLAPYPPLRDQTSVGPWQLIPFAEFKQRHARGREVYREARELATAYKVNDASWMPLGGIIAPNGGRVGDAIPRELLRPLRHALVAALIDSNPPS